MRKPISEQFINYLKCESDLEKIFLAKHSVGNGKSNKLSRCKNVCFQSSKKCEIKFAFQYVGINMQYRIGNPAIHFVTFVIKMAT